MINWIILLISLVATYTHTHLFGHHAVSTTLRGWDGETGTLRSPQCTQPMTVSYGMEINNWMIDALDRINNKQCINICRKKFIGILFKHEASWDCDRKFICGFRCMLFDSDMAFACVQIGVKSEGAIHLRHQLQWMTRNVTFVLHVVIVFRKSR